MACFSDLERFGGPFLRSILSLSSSRFLSSFRRSSCKWWSSGDQLDFSTNGLGSVFLGLLWKK